MYCRECGSKLNKGARFCNACGTKINVEAAESDSLISAKKKKKGVVIAVSIMVVLLILGILLVSLTVFGGADKIRVARLCSLGDRYLSELEYEQAVVAYEAAIEIDPKAEDAYIGLADAYIGLGDYESALEALDRGIEETNSRKLKDYYYDVNKEYEAFGEHDAEAKDTQIQPEEYIEKSDENFTYDQNDEGFEEKFSDENNVVVLNAGKYMIDIPEGYRVDLRAETDTVVSIYTIEKSSGDTEFLSYKEVYYAGRTLWNDGVWRTRSYGDNGYITYLTVYSGSIRADGQKLYYDDETDTSGHWDDYDSLDELAWYSETDIDGIYAVEIFEGQTVTIERSNSGGTIHTWVQGSDDLTGYWVDMDYSWGGNSEYIHTYELGSGGYGYFDSHHKFQYTVTNGYMYWFTESSNEGMLTISFEETTEPDISSDAD